MPRIRRVEHFDFKTGQRRITETIISEEASIERRFEELRAVTSEAAGDGVPIMWVVCNGCGRRVEVEEPALPYGWTATGEGDFCERCS